MNTASSCASPNKNFLHWSGTLLGLAAGNLLVFWELGTTVMYFAILLSIKYLVCEPINCTAVRGLRVLHKLDLYTSVIYTQLEIYPRPKEPFPTIRLRRWALPSQQGDSQVGPRNSWAPSIHNMIHSFWQAHGEIEKEMVISVAEIAVSLTIHCTGYPHQTRALTGGGFTKLHSPHLFCLRPYLAPITKYHIFYLMVCLSLLIKLDKIKSLAGMHDGVTTTAFLPFFRSTGKTFIFETFSSGYIEIILCFL